MEVLDYSEKWGKDIDEAVKLALIDLKCSKDQVKVTVLAEPSRGFFGIGARLAKVRVELINKPESASKTEPVSNDSDVSKTKVVNHAVQMSKQNDFRRKGRNAPLKKKAAADNTEKSVEKAEIIDKVSSVVPSAVESGSPAVDSSSVVQEGEMSVSSSSDNDASKREKNTSSSNSRGRKSRSDRQIMNISKFSIVENEPDAVRVTDGPAIEFLNTLLTKMGLELNVTAYEKNNVLYISIDGKDSGTIIGKRGQTLDAIQYLTSLVVNKDREKYIRVIVNAENYREKREITLEKLALRLADSVIKSRKSVRLEPMNPYERKVIHSTLQRNDRINTRSEGEEPHRRVIIELKR